MGSDAKEWLQAKGVPMLMEKGIEAVIENKPDDPALFLSQFFAEQHNNSIARNSSCGSPTTTMTKYVNRDTKKKMKMLNIAVTIPDENPEKVNAASLAVMIHDKVNHLVVDVRSDTRGGTITGSLFRTCEDIIVNSCKYASEWKEFDAVVFVSAQSPDLDETAAVPLLQAMREAKVNTKVYILTGGLKGWMQHYSTDSALVKDYDVAVWERTGLQQNPTALAARRGSLVRLAISVPDTPEKMNAAALSMFVKDKLDTCIIVDVRINTEGGRIPGSIEIPCDELIASPKKFAEQWTDKYAVVFVSMKSPDLDLTVAGPIMQALIERDSHCSVFILLDGMRGWISTNHRDPTLVADYDEAIWTVGRHRCSLGDGMAHNDAGRVAAPNSSAIKRKMTTMTIDVPEAPQTMAPVELSTLLKAQHGSPRKGSSTRCLIVDVRDSTEGGKIAGSVSIPFDSLMKDIQSFAKKWQNTAAIVFVSLVSPDLDVTAATATLHQMHEIESPADVFILIDGVKGWMSRYGGIPVLVDDYDPAMWGSPRRFVKKDVNLGIDVPEPPAKIPPSELALLVKGGGDALVVVDVRDVTDGGQIAGSLSVPYQSITSDPENYAAEWTTKSSIVFVSSLSNDLDESAAIPVMQALKARGSKAQVCVFFSFLFSIFYHFQRYKKQVFILMGGLKSWMQQYHRDANLTRDCLPEKWGLADTKPEE